MTSETQHFLDQLKAAIEGVLFVTAGDYPLNMFVWNVEEDGEFNTSNFLQRQRYLAPIEAADFFGLDEYLDGYQHWGVSILNPSAHMAEKKERALMYAQRADRFLNFLSSQAVEFAAYRVVKYDLPIDDETGERLVDHRLGSKTYESSRLVIGKVSDGVWIAVSSYEDWNDIEYETDEKFISADLQQVTRQIDERLQSIREASSDLVFIRRNCYDAHDEATKLIFEVANSKAAVIDRVLHGNGFVRTCDFDSLSLQGEDMSIDCPEGLADDDSYEKFVPIDQLMKSYLTNLKTIFVGTHSVFDVYFVGQDFAGNWLGLSTIAVWT